MGVVRMGPTAALAPGTPRRDLRNTTYAVMLTKNATALTPASAYDAHTKASTMATTGTPGPIVCAMPMAAAAPSTVPPTRPRLADAVSVNSGLSITATVSGSQ